MPAFAKDCLQGKTVLIAGGLGAIGRVVVSALLEHSARVAVNDVLSVEHAGQLGKDLAWPSERFVYVRADVTRPEGAEELARKTLEAFGSLEVALCHAGMAHSCPILQYSEAEWDRIMDLNLKSAFLVAQASARAMVERGINGGCSLYPMD
jgi:2-deoxy-D-gluconate 3-dehydrogenase